MFYPLSICSNEMIQNTAKAVYIEIFIATSLVIVKNENQGSQQKGENYDIMKTATKDKNIDMVF